MVHDYHEGLEGYDPRQLLHDGCAECESRGKDVGKAIVLLDSENFARAWKRAYDWEATNGGGWEVVGPISQAERPLLAALWSLQIQFQRAGIPLTGELPEGVRDSV